jgi:hypothetical protein
MLVLDVGAIIRTSYNPPSLLYRVISIQHTPEGTVNFVCHLTEDRAGRHGTLDIIGFT